MTLVGTLTSGVRLKVKHKAIRARKIIIAWEPRSVLLKFPKKSIEASGEPVNFTKRERFWVGDVVAGSLVST